MTHFLGAVVVPNIYKNELEDYLEIALDKFDENKEVPSYVFQTKQEIIERARRINAEFIEVYEECQNKPDLIGTKYSASSVKYAEEQALLRSNWTDEDFHKFSTSGESLDAEGNLLSTYNQDSKWDWYAVGGRWESLMADRQGESVGLLLTKVDLAIQHLSRDSSSTYHEELWIPHHLVSHDGTDFVWNSSREMGWWGTYSETSSLLEWFETMKKTLMGLTEDASVYYIDFHI